MAHCSIAKTDLSSHQAGYCSSSSARHSSVLASGRPLDGMRSKLEELHLTTEDDYVLYYNGSMVANVGTGEIIHQQIIDGKAAKRVATLAQEFGLNTHAFSQIHGLITPKTSQYTEVEASINGLNITEMDFAQLADDHPIIKAMIVGEPENSLKPSLNYQRNGVKNLLWYKVRPSF